MICGSDFSKAQHESCLLLARARSGSVFSAGERVPMLVKSCYHKTTCAVAAFTLCTILSAMCAVLPTPALADDESPALGILTTEPFSALETQWKTVLDSIDAGEYARAGEELRVLEELKVKADLPVLESYSLQLVAEGLLRLREGKREEAAFLAKNALSLSPGMPSVILKSLRLVQATGVEPLGSQLWKLLAGTWAYPEFLLDVLSLALYPILWAFTFGMFATYLLLFSHKIRDVLGVTARFFPQGWRGILGPWTTVVLLFLPIIVGPLWCVFLWSLLLMLLPGRKWLIAWSGALIVSWGGAVLLRENLARNLDDSSFRQVLRVVSGVYSSVDEVRLKEIVERSRQDGLAWWSYGQVLRRAGDLKGAREAFGQAGAIFGNQPWTVAQEGSIALMERRFADADKLYHDAEAKGLRGVEFFYNYSKIKFHLFDTEASSKFDSEAFRRDQQRVARLKEREELLGDAGNFVVAEIALPVPQILRAVYRAKAAATSSEAVLSKSLMWGLSAQLMLVAGGLLILCWFLTTRLRIRTRRNPTFYPPAAANSPFAAILYLVPGGAWVRGGSPAWAFLVLSSVALWLMPLAGWPYQRAKLFALWPSLYLYYVLAVMAVIFLVDCVGYYFVEEKLDAERGN